MVSPPSTLRTYLALARVSNLPTIWTNVLAGMVLSGGAVQPLRWTLLAAALSLIYCSGMVNNDVADAPIDAVERPDRPIPAGNISREQARTFGGILMAFGAGAALGSAARLGNTAILTLGGLLGLLGLTIHYYNLRHKRDPLGPVVMGICRGLVYCVASVAVVGAVGMAVLAGAAVMTAYVTALTLVAKHGGARYGWSIGWLIAGISLVDAAVIAAAGSPQLALLTLAGFPLTILAQRVVRGT